MGAISHYVVNAYLRVDGCIRASWLQTKEIEALSETLAWVERCRFERLSAYDARRVIALIAERDRVPVPVGECQSSHRWIDNGLRVTHLLFNCRSDSYS